MSQPQRVFENCHCLKDMSLWPKIKSKSNVRIEGNIENKSCCAMWVDQNQYSNLIVSLKIAHFDVNSPKMTPELDQN